MEEELCHKYQCSGSLKDEFASLFLKQPNIGWPANGWSIMEANGYQEWKRYAVAQRLRRRYAAGEGPFSAAEAGELRAELGMAGPSSRSDEPEQQHHFNSGVRIVRNCVKLHSLRNAWFDGSVNMACMKDIVLAMRIYRVVSEDDHNILYKHDFHILGSNTLRDLYKTIPCSHDLTSWSELGRVFRNWEEEDNFQTRIDSFPIAFNKPYEINHWPGCKHIIYFLDAWYLGVTDILNKQFYPRYKAHEKWRAQSCSICREETASWIYLEEDEEAEKLTSQSFWCQHCYELFSHLCSRILSDSKKYIIAFDEIH